MLHAAKVGAIDDPVWTDGNGSTTKKPLRRRRRALATVLLVLVGLGIVYIPAVMALSRLEFGNGAFWRAPVRIDYCGRRYDQDPGLRAGTPASLIVPYTVAQVKWQEVARTFSLRPIYAEVLTSHPNSAVCAFFLFVPAGDQRWWSYRLSGGP